MPQNSIKAKTLITYVPQVWKGQNIVTEIGVYINTNPRTYLFQYISNLYLFKLFGCKMQFS